MKNCNNAPSSKILGLTTAFALGMANHSTAAPEVLLNGTLSTSALGFTTFLDETEVGSRAWSFRNNTNPMAPINTGGALSTVTPEAVTLTGGSDLTITGALYAGITGYNWGAGFTDQAARNAMTNGTGFFNSPMSITIEPSALINGQVYRVELLAFTGFAPDRRFNVTANGVDRVTDWTILNTSPFNQVLEFEVAADAGGIVLDITPGSEGDTNPFIHGLAITPLSEDTDMDGLSDAFEQLIIDADAGDVITSFADVLPGDDFDNDFSTNLQEFQRNTSPTDDDTDDDTLLDGYEIGTEWVSVTSTGTNPLLPDTDRDGLNDGIENPDLPYVDENQPGTDPTLDDTDDDFLGDGFEVGNNLDPTDPTGDNGLSGDPDSDSLTNDQEQTLGTNPQDNDTDDDGLTDNVETDFGFASYFDPEDTGTDPLNPDSDGDGLLDGVEVPGQTFVDANQPGTDPTVADSDGDGFGDLTEVNAATDPTDFNNFPANPIVVSQWSFEDNLDDTAAAGVTADQLTDNVGGVTYVPGIIGNAVVIPSGSLTAATSADLHLPGSWTMEAYVWRDLNNLQTTEFERFWTKWGLVATEYHWSFRGTSGEAVPDGSDLFVNGAALIDHDATTTTLPFEQWVHVALVGDVVAGTIRTYVNGVDVGGVPYVAITPTSQSMNFGNIGNDTFAQFSGFIDEALIHEGAVDQAYLESRASLVPAGASFQTWIDGFTFDLGADLTPTGDPDQDGLPNSVEFVVGGNPATGMDAALMPTLELITADLGLGAGTTDYFLFTYRRTDESVAAGLTAVGETDTDLEGTWTPAVGGVDGVTEVVENNAVWTDPVATDTDRVQLYVPRGNNTKLFGRLSVEVP